MLERRDSCLSPTDIGIVPYAPQYITLHLTAYPVLQPLQLPPRDSGRAQGSRRVRGETGRAGGDCVPVCLCPYG